MTNIFSYINDVLFLKKRNLLSNIDDESQYNGFMINRWVSMYSPAIANIINCTSNKYFSVFDTKKDSYNFLVDMLPRQSFRRINYIKRAPKTDGVDSDTVAMLANSLELSRREINYYLETNDIDIEKLKKACHTT